jgi:hypothetical protein
LTEGGPVPKTDLEVRLSATLSLGALGAVVAAGCGTGRATYRPAVPRVAEGAGLRAELTELDLPNIPRAARLAVALDSGPTRPPPALMEARLSGNGAPPCASGTRARLLVVDGQPRWDRPVPLVAGTPQRILLEYPTTDPLAGDGFVDLLVDAGGGAGWRCLRLPVTGDDPRLRWRSSGAWALGGSLRLDGTLYGIIRVGRWFPAVRLGAEAGVGFTDCLVACPGKEPLLPAYRNFPVAVTADVFPLQVGAFALGLEGAAEVFLRSAGHSPAGGLRVALRLALVPPPRHGLPRGPHMGFGSIDLATRFWVTDTGTEESGWVQMVGVTWDFGL